MDDDEIFPVPYGELRYAGLENRIYAMRQGLEADLSSSRHGRLVWRLAPMMARLTRRTR